MQFSGFIFPRKEECFGKPYALLANETLRWKFCKNIQSVKAQINKDWKTQDNRKILLKFLE